MTALTALTAGLIVVSPGQSIQDALDISAAGDTVLLMPGVHTGTGEHLVFLNGSHNGVTLLGDTGNPGSVVLEGGGLSGSVIHIDGISTDTLDRSTVLSGFTVSGGSTEELGGGLFSYYASPTIIALNFHECHSGSGGGAYLWRGSPRLVSCVFDSNTCNTSGAGIYAYAGEGLELLSCVFEDNSSTDDGGGVYLFHSSPLVRNCLFTGNYAWDNGAGLYLYAYSSPDIGWCTFEGNSTTYEGSAVYFRVGSEAVMHDCIITGNITPALWIDGGGDPQFNHNCLWGNPDGDWGNLPDQTGYDGNISQDPILVDGHHLSQTASGQPQNSPCVNAGSVNASEPGLNIYWTRTDQSPDTGQSDMGFHYGPQPQYTGVDPGSVTPSALRIYPLPAVSSVTVEHPGGPGTLSVYDLSGRLVTESPSAEDGNTRLRLSGLPGGVYIVVYRGGAGALSQRMVLL